MSVIDPPNASDITLSPQLEPAYQGVPIIRVSVYRKASTKAGKAMYTTLPLPEYAAKKGERHDVPQQVFGFQQGKASAGWEVMSARVNQTRFWACSTATFTIAASMQPASHPKLPPVRPEDVVTIEMGYAPALTSKIGDPGVWLLPVFYGVVDIVKERGGNGGHDGIMLTVTARDPVRYLVDNKIRAVYLNQFLGRRANRGYAIMDLIWMGAQIDPVEWDTSFADRDGVADKYFMDSRSNSGQTFPGVSFKGDAQGYGYDVDDKGNKKAAVDAQGMAMLGKVGPENCYVKIGAIEASERVIPPPAADGKGTVNGIPIMDRFPLDLIKHFSLLETAPRELWASPVDGRLNWMARRTDMRRVLGAWGPKEQARRQYFYRFPENRANVMMYTNEWTTVGTVSHFTISNTQAHGEAQSGNNEFFAQSPVAQLEDVHRNTMAGAAPDERFLRRFTRQRFVYDDTMSENDANFNILAASLFTIWGKDVETGMFQTIGDPSIQVGEGIQLFNFGMFGRRLVPDPKNPGKWVQGGPPGVFRVEGLQHLYASGGADKGFTTVVIFNSIDPPSFQVHTDADDRRLPFMPNQAGMDSQSHIKGIKLLSVIPPAS